MLQKRAEPLMTPHIKRIYSDGKPLIFKEYRELDGLSRNVNNVGDPTDFFL
jgi:hypothetical protein